MFRKVHDYSKIRHMCECYSVRSQTILNSSGWVNAVLKGYDYSELCRCVDAIQKLFWTLADVWVLFRKVCDYSKLCRCVNALQKGLWLFWTLQMCGCCFPCLFQWWKFCSIQLKITLLEGQLHYILWVQFLEKHKFDLSPTFIAF